MKDLRKKKYNNVEAVDVIDQVSNFYLSTKHPKDYGTGVEYTSVEVHTLKYIADHPGITVTELAKAYGKTKGAISQVLKKLEINNLIYREADPNNDNKMFIYISKDGKKLDKLHRGYDDRGFGESMNPVRNLFTDEEVNTAFAVLETWLNVRREVEQRREDDKKKERKEKMRLQRLEKKKKL